MFKTVEEYLNSEKTKADLDCYMKNVLFEVLKFKQDIYEKLLEDSIADSILIENNKIKICLGEEYGNLQMIFHENDFTAAPNVILTRGNFEPEELAMVCRILKIFAREKDITVFDIGANVGWYTLNIRKRIKNSEVYSFEPSPITFERLCDNLNENDLDINNAINIGFYTENSQLDFYYNIEESGSSSLANIRETEAVTKISVEMMKLDDWVEENHITDLDFIKCDVEGAEYFVYQGGKEIIKKYKPIIFSEMLRKWSAKFGYHPNDIINFFGEMGYQCYVIDKGCLRRFYKVDTQTIQTNYFFLDPVKHKRILEEFDL